MSVALSADSGEMTLGTEAGFTILTGKGDRRFLGRLFHFPSPAKSAGSFMSPAFISASRTEENPCRNRDDRDRIYQF
jgi:hypothetical protein